jgi:hypothetical protein
MGVEDMSSFLSTKLLGHLKSISNPSCYYILISISKLVEMPFHTAKLDIGYRIGSIRVQIPFGDDYGQRQCYQDQVGIHC